MPFSVLEEHFDGAVLVIEAKRFPDHRGFFTELYRSDLFAEIGLPSEFMQLNLSRSRKGVIRGLHFQWDPPMGKLMRVARGKAFLVAVDLRKNSPFLGKWFGMEVSEDDNLLIWAPASFARGFAALEDNTEIEYLCTATYNPKGEGAIRWNDPDINISWPIKDPVLSEKDRNAMFFKEWLSRPESNVFV